MNSINSKAFPFRNARGDGVGQKLDLKSKTRYKFKANVKQLNDLSDIVMQTYSAELEIGSPGSSRFSSSFIVFESTSRYPPA